MITQLYVYFNALIFVLLIFFISADFIKCESIYGGVSILEVQDLGQWIDKYLRRNFSSGSSDLGQWIDK